MSTRVGGRERRESGPQAPRLRLHFGAKIKVLLLANMIPLGFLSWLLFRIASGEDWKLAAGVDGERLTLTLIVLIGSCIVLAASSWILMPVGRWLRDYPDWCMRHRSAARWAIPAGLGWLAWATLALVAATASILALMLLVTGLWELLTQAHAAHTAQSGGG